MAYEGLMAQIANPRVADVAGAMDYREQKMQAQKERERQETVRALMGKAITGLKEGSDLRRLADQDPETFINFAKVMGIPPNDGARLQQLSDDVYTLAGLAQQDPTQAISYAQQLRDQRAGMGLETPELDKFLVAAQENPNKAIQSTLVLNQSLNRGRIAEQELANREMALKERGLDIKEKELDMGGGANIGTYNPRDYTTESWSKFVQTKDPSMLKRYESNRVVNIGGVDYLVDTTTNERVPISTVSEVADNKSIIAESESRAKQEGKSRAEIAVKQQGQAGKLEDADRLYTELSGGDLNLIYGRGEKWFPELLRSQKGIDLMAKKDQLVGMLNLAARGQLQGQGSITDAEAKTVLDAATTLSNPNISPKEAKAALESAMKNIYRNAGKDFSQKPDQKTDQKADKKMSREEMDAYLNGLGG